MILGTRPSPGVLLALVLIPVLAASARAEDVPGELIVRYRPGVRTMEMSAARPEDGRELVRRFPRFGMELIRVTGPSTDAMTRIAQEPGVLYVEPNRIWRADRVPNDPRFRDLWGLQNTGQAGGAIGADIRATQAWDLFTGDPSLMIGVIDSGVDLGHPDLADNLWTNPGEIPANGLDDDGNGYVDDVHGWNAVLGNGNPIDDHGHGTHVAGTIAAVGNNAFGITGVCWRAKIVAIKFLDAEGAGTTADALTAIDYAITVGVRVTNNSWGGGAFSQALLDAIEEAGRHGQLFVCAAGNSRNDNDRSPRYPSSYETPYLISVAATDPSDHLSSYSNFGALSVDLGAPGDNIVSLAPGGGLRLLSGTSMATPHVTGVVALAMGSFPSASNLVIRDQVLASVDSLPALRGKVRTGGRLNAFLALLTPDSVPPGRISDLAVRETSSNGVVLTWTATGDDEDRGRATRVDLRRADTPILDDAAFEAAVPVAAPEPDSSGSPQTADVRGLAFQTTYWFAMRAQDEYGTPGPLSNTVSATTLEPPELEATPASFATELPVGAGTELLWTLRNAAGGTLDFEIPEPVLVFSQPEPFAAASLSKEQTDNREGPPVVQGQGGPDGFGYRWIDSREPGGPVYEWQDIREVGTRITLSGDDVTTSALPIGFAFPFYGSTFTLLRINSNGYLSFTETNSEPVNQPLPSPSAPANLVAPFWDDLLLGLSSRIWLFSDGLRCIVTWEGATHYPYGGPYTFQVILEPSGEIRFQYASMADPLDLATVGIQNGTRQLGLTTAFNADYVDSGLAVRILPVPEWLSVSPRSGRLLAGESRDLTISVRSDGLDGGLYHGSLTLLTNDPDEDTTAVPVELRVIGAPNVLSAPGELDYGTVFVGQQAVRALSVTNSGSDRLVITSIASADPDVHVDVGSMTLNPREVRKVAVTFAPATAHPLDSPLVIASNDADEPMRSVRLRGQSLVAPAMRVEPDSLVLAMRTDETAHRSVRISNPGGSDLVYEASVELSTALAGAAQGRRTQPFAALDAAGSLPEPDRVGGPDRQGYTYRDSDEPGGPVFDWADIRARGTQLSLSGGDGNAGPVPIGFAFPFYGSSFTTLRVCLNGWISFTNISSGRTNYTLPNNYSLVPENLIAVFWDDLEFGAARRAWYYNDGERLIVQFQDAYRFGEPSTFGNTFQAILYPNGTIVFQYRRMAALDLRSATVGIQNGARDDGLQIAFNEPFLRDSFAVRIQPPPRFMAVQPGFGVVPAGGAADLDVGFDADGLFGGSYVGAIQVTGNDPLVSQRTVPVRIQVTGIPQVALSPATLDFGTVFSGFPEVRTLRLTNFGTDILEISEIVSEDPAFAVDRSRLSIPALASAEVQVTFGGSEPREHAATIRVRSNDPEHPEMTLAASGRIVPPPVIAIEPATVAADLAIPESVTRTVTLRNTGGSPLDFTAVSVFGPLPSAQRRRAVGMAAADPDVRLTGGGGPDAFGYTWRDSDHEGGPAFGWLDITAIGSPVVFAAGGDDETVTGIPIGFDFPFYGVVRRTVNVCSNGWLSFTSAVTSRIDTPLPSAQVGVPENLLAAFWDDLVPGVTATRLWTWSDGRRFVATWNAVLRSGSGGPYTFQIVLEPTGRILFQYRSMKGARLAEATIGIQNASRDDGLTVVHDASYVHDSLAIEFRSVPEFIRVRPEAGRIEAGGSLDLSVDLDARGLFGATYEGGVRVATNDPLRGVTVIPVELRAIGIPEIATDPAGLEFAEILAGASSDLVLRVLNRGDDTLHVSGLAASGPFAVVHGPPLPYSIVPRYPLEVTLRFTPPAPCDPCTGGLTVTSDDPVRGATVVPLAGRAAPAPEIDGLPRGLGAALARELGIRAADRPVVIRNTGAAPLNWTAVAYSMLPSAEADTPAPEGADGAAEDPKGVDGESGRVTVASSGGPDASGYRWADSDDPAGVPFQWADITQIGTPVPLTLDDENIGPFALPFRFPFYGQTFDSIRVCSNGWLSFTSQLTTYTNVSIPSVAAGVPANLIAPFWDDLTYAVNRGDAFSHFDGEKQIFSFHRVRRYGGDAFVTFQVFLYPSGTIDFQYLDMAGRIDNATIGIQNAARNVATEVVYNAPYVHNGLRIRIAPRAGWLSVRPDHGTIAPGASDTLDIGFDGSVFEDGSYAGMLRIASNDVDEPSLEVPCTMNVGLAAGRLDIEARSLPGERRWVGARIAPPAGTDPADILVSSLKIQRAVPVTLEKPVHAGDRFLKVRFDGNAVRALLPAGRRIPVEVVGEVDGVTWFAATDTVRVGRGGRDGDDDDDRDRDCDPAALAPPRAEAEPVPLEFGLRSSGGNPVRGDAVLELSLPAAGAPDVSVYDARGALVRHLASGPMPAGRHRLRWDGAGTRGAPVPAGVYFVRATMRSEPARVVRIVWLR